MAHNAFLETSSQPQFSLSSFVSILCNTLVWRWRNEFRKIYLQQVNVLNDFIVWLTDSLLSWLEIWLILLVQDTGFLGKGVCCVFFFFIHSMVPIRDVHQNYGFSSSWYIVRLKHSDPSAFRCDLTNEELAKVVYVIGRNFKICAIHQIPFSMPQLQATPRWSFP